MRASNSEFKPNINGVIQGRICGRHYFSERFHYGKALIISGGLNIV